MKTDSIPMLTAVIAMLALGKPSASEASFINFDFDSPILPLVPDAFFNVPIAQALPGWRGYIGGVEVSHVTYNTVSLGAADISFHGLDSLWRPLDGTYSVLLQPSGGPAPISTAIAQSGQIPVDAKSLTFLVSPTYKFETTFSGQSIPLFEIGATARYLVLAGDISLFAGQTGELRFGGSGFLDRIQFSPQPVPEPSTWALLGLCAVVLGYRLRRRAS